MKGISLTGELERPIQPGWDVAFFRDGQDHPCFLVTACDTTVIVCLRSVPTRLTSVCKVQLLEELVMWILLSSISYKANLSWIPLSGGSREWILLFKWLFKRNPSHLNSLVFDVNCLYSQYSQCRSFQEVLWFLKIFISRWKSGGQKWEPNGKKNKQPVWNSINGLICFSLRSGDESSPFSAPQGVRVPG